MGDRQPARITHWRDLPRHPRRRIVDIGVPADGEGVHQPPRRVRLDDLALDVDPAGVRLLVDDRRAGAEVRIDDRAEVVALHEIGVGQRLPDAFRSGANVDLVDVHGCIHGCLQGVFEVGHAAHPWLGVLADPSVMDKADGDRIEEVQLATPGATACDQVRRFQDAQMLHDAEAGHPRQRRLELLQRLAVAHEEPIEEEPPAGVGQCPFSVILHPGAWDQMEDHGLDTGTARSSTNFTSRSASRGSSRSMGLLIRSYLKPCARIGRA